MVLNGYTMKQLKSQKTKTLAVRNNGRSSDAVSPNFILGCNAQCRYCYEKRWGRNKIYVNQNVDDILKSCEDWVMRQRWPKVPNQCDPVYYIVDIGCNTDITYHWKDYDWRYVFDYFKRHPRMKASFATKYVSNSLLEYNPDGKARIRFSLMPQIMSDIIEPNTSSIKRRIEAIDRYIDAGYEIHINYSPIVVYNGWEEDYEELFENVAAVKYAEQLKFEVIFLTHNVTLHEKNVKLYPEAEEVLWRPEIQEEKISKYGGNNLRYEWQLKNEYINTFKQIFKEYFDLNTIRYIF